MTTPNLDALAKLAPFKLSTDHEGDGYEISRRDRVQFLDPDDVVAALNEWAELRKDLWSPHSAVVQENARLKRENAELRAENARIRAGYEKAGMVDRPIAKLTKFVGDENGPRVYGDDGGDPKELVGIEVAVALNDWLLLRAYRERTEKGKRLLVEWIRAVKAEGGPIMEWMHRHKLETAMANLDLWKIDLGGEPGQGAADGN